MTRVSHSVKQEALPGSGDLKQKLLPGTDRDCPVGHSTAALRTQERFKPY